MNIEQLIQENTAALVRLTAAIENMDATVAKAEVAAAEVKKPEKAENATKPSTGTASATQTSAAPSEAGATAAPAAAEPMAYAELQAPGLKLYKSNRDALVTILKHYGVAKLDQVPQELWPEAKRKVEEALQA